MLFDELRRIMNLDCMVAMDAFTKHALSRCCLLLMHVYNAMHRADKALLLKVTADYVRLQITAAISNPEANEELVQFLRGVLGVRLSLLTLVRGT